MKRRETLVALAMLGVTPFASHAQKATKTFRVGHLAAGARTPDGLPPPYFREAMHKLGYIEGKNVVYEARFAAGKVDRLPELAAELLKLKVDVIMTSGWPSTMAAKQASSVIPIVMAPASGDAVAGGLVASLARPGGNVTGSTNVSTDVIGKQLEILKEAFPRVSRVAVLYCPASGGAIAQIRWSEIQTAARSLKVHVQPIEVSGPGEIDGALRAASAERADAIFVHDCSVIPTKAVDVITRTKLPAIYPTSRFAEAGALLVYGPSGTELARRAAYFVDKILRGTQPADLPVEQPTKFELVINLKTAKQIGLTIPPNVLARADKVIK